MHKITNKLFLLMLLLSSQSLAGVSVLLVERQDDNCTYSAFYDAPPNENGVLVLRARSSANEACMFNEKQTLDTLNDALVLFETRGDLAKINSIMLGHVENFPWLQKYLLDASRSDNDWNKETGMSIAGNNNRYINSLLFGSPE